MIALREPPTLQTPQPSLPQVQHKAARHGELQLGFVKRDQQTFINHRFFRAPLQVMRSITDGAGCACVYILSPTGGVVQGDRYNIQITVEDHAHALVTTLAATKVYRMPQGKAEQNVTIEVMPGATLEYVPDAAILFEDADYEQTLDIYLHEGAVLIMQDCVMPGRLAAGESLRFRRFHNRLTVRDSQGLLLHEVQEVIPQTRNPDRIGLLEGYRSWGNWYLLGDLERLEIDAAIFCEQQSNLLEREEKVLGSASRLYRNGLSVRLLTYYWSPLADHLTRLRDTIRSEYMHLPVSDLRK